MKELIPTMPFGLTFLFPVQRRAGSEGAAAGEAGAVGMCEQVIHVNHDGGLGFN